MPSNAPSRAAVTLFGRESIVEQAIADAGAGRTLFAVEGVTGIGKSALLERVSSQISSNPSSFLVSLSAAERPSETHTIGSIYAQLRQLPIDPERLAGELQQHIDTGVPFPVRKMFAAVLADVAKLVTDKAENSIDAIREIVAGEDAPSDAFEHLDSLDAESQRFFLNKFLRAVEGSGYRIIISIDDLDAAEPSLIAFVRFLIKEKPQTVTLLLAHNTEIGTNLNWDHVTADVRARGGTLLRVEQINRAGIGEWFLSELGRSPGLDEIEALESSCHGRAMDLKLAIAAKRDGTGNTIRADYSGYYENARSRLGAEAQLVGELLAMLPRDCIVRAEVLSAAAASAGITRLTPALDELSAARLIKRKDGLVGFDHSSVREWWYGSIDGHRRLSLERFWLDVVRGHIERLTDVTYAGLLPAIISPLLAENSLQVVADIGKRFIAAGQVGTGLQLLDRTWRFEPSTNPGDSTVFQHALLAARTRIDIGQYMEADEPLTFAESIAADTTSRVQVTLVRMRLALRRNTFGVLRQMWHQLNSQAQGESLAEAEILLNTALRDLFDSSELASSRDRLLSLRTTATGALECSIDRSLARTLAKLGELDSALYFATQALETSRDLDSIRDLGNANLAMAEVLRYRSDFPLAMQHYRVAADLARSIGNRDSLLWSLLGEVASFIQSGAPSDAVAAFQELDLLLAQPGYEHPLETAHAALLHILAEGSVDSVDETIALYHSLGITWPIEFLATVRESGGIHTNVLL